MSTQQNEVAALCFLRDQVPEILKQECSNICSIYLHRCGEHWVALEQSVYLLYKVLHHKANVAVFYLTDGNCFVMTEVPDAIVHRLRDVWEGEEMAGGGVKYDTACAIDRDEFKEWKGSVIVDTDSMALLPMNIAK